MSNQDKINLLDLIDLKFLQEFQDFFAKTLDLAAITIDAKGPVTKPSNFNEFCMKFVRCSKDGIKKCDEVHNKWGRSSSKKDEPTIYTCPNGLIEFSVPLFIKNQYLGALIAGQVFLEQPDEDKYRKTAKKLGFDENEYISAIKKVKIVSSEKLDDYKHLLFIIGKCISSIAEKELELREKTNRDYFYRNIVETIRNSLDIDKTFEIICSEIAKHYNAGRVAIIQMMGKYKNEVIRSEYVYDKKIKRVEAITSQTNQVFEYIAQNIFFDKKNLYYQNIEKSDAPDYFKEFYKNLGVNSNVFIPIKKDSEEWGMITISYSKPRDWIENEINLLEMIAGQIYIAIKQAELYTETKQQAEREKILRDIANNIISSFDIEKIKQEIVNQVGTLFQADRVAIAYYDKEIKDYVITKNAEFKSSENVKSFVGVNFNNEPGFNKDVRDRHFKGKDIIFDNLDIYLLENDLKGNDVEYFYKNFGFISSAVMNMYYEKEVLGDLIVTFEKPRKFSDNEINFLRTLADQAGGAFHQAELYLKIKQQAEREKSIRKITEKIRSSLDIEETLSFICEETTKLFGVQRVAITSFPDLENYEKFTMRKEYKLYPKIKGYLDAKGFHKSAAYWGYNLIEKGKVLAFDNIENADVPEFFKETYSAMGIKSIIGTAIKKGKSVWGTFVLSEHENYRHWSEEEKQLLTTIADQIYVAINQAELFEKQKKAAEKEKILRQVIEASRSTLVFEEVLNDICKSILDLFKVGRVSIGKISEDETRDSFVIIEQKADENIISSGIIEGYKALPEYWANHLAKNNEIILVNNIQEAEIPEQPKNIATKMGIKSVIAVPLGTKDFLWGGLFLSEYDYYREWTKEEAELLETIASQIYVAIRQSELFEKQKKAAEREKILRNAIEASRKSLVLNDVLMEICNGIINLLKVDRVTIGKLPEEFTGQGFVLVEAGASNNIVTSKDVEFLDVVEYWKWYMVENDAPRAIANIQESDLPDFVKDKYSEMGVKSMLHIPVGAGKLKWGGIFISEYKCIREWDVDEINLLETIAAQSYVAIRQSELYEKEKKTVEREKILRKIIEASRKSMNFDDVLKDICKEILKLLEFGRVSIGVVSKELSIIDKFVIVSNDYSWNQDNSIPEFKILADFWKKHFLETGEIKPVTNIEESDLPEDIKKIYLEIGTKSVVGIPLKAEYVVWGGLILSENNLYKTWNKEELEFFETIGTQIYIAARQSELYEKEKKAAEKEQLLRKVIESSRRSLVFKDVANDICKAVIDVFKVDRVTVGKIPQDMESDAYVMIEQSSRPDIKTSRQAINFVPVANYWKRYILSEGKTKAVNNIEESDFPDYVKEIYKEMGVKSIICAVLGAGDFRWGGIFISQYDYHREWTKEELKLLETIAAQSYVAIRQSELYENEKRTAERETMLRKIFEVIRSSLDINVIKNSIVTEICKVLDADLCFMMQYDEPEDKFLVDEYSEYRSSDKGMSFIGYDSDAPSVKFFMDAFKKNKEIHFENVHEFIKQHNLEGTLEEEFLTGEIYNLKSSYSVAINYADKMLGHILVEFTRDYKKLDDETLQFLRVIATQAGIALYQASLYKLTQWQAESETLTRKILETIRSTLDINEVKTKIVTEVGKAVNADRCFIVEYDKENDKFLPVKDEYLSSDEIISYKGVDVNVDVPYFVEVLKKGEKIFINSTKNFMEENLYDKELEKITIEKYNIKSAFGVPFSYYNDLLGLLVVHYVAKERLISSEEIEMLDTIANQIAIAIHQAKLYKQTQLQAEREKVGKNIIEILRSSLDKLTIKHLFVRNIGKLLKADRVLFSEYDKESEMYLPVDEKSEYLSSSDIKSFVGYDWSSFEAIEYIQPLLEKRELNIFNWNEYIQQNPKSHDFIRLFESSNIKSSYNFPVLYQAQVMGFFSIDYTKEVTRLSDEDINRIRNMCTQAGIALYHADLYIKAQESDKIKGNFISNISNMLVDPLNKIIQYSEIVPQSELDYNKQKEYLNNINKEGKELLEIREKLDNLARMDNRIKNPFEG